MLMGTTKQRVPARFQRLSKWFITLMEDTVIKKTFDEADAIIKREKLFEEIMDDIEDFVYDPNTTENRLIDIESYSLRKALSKRVTDVYMGTGVFAEFNR